MSKAGRSYSPEYKEQAVRAVVETDRTVAEVARELMLNEQTLRNWVNRYREECGHEETPSVATLAKVREQEREIRELRMQLEFMKKAAAYFAQDAR